MPVPVDRSLRLPESEYFPDPQEKSGMAPDHTVSDDALTTLDICRGRSCEICSSRSRKLTGAFLLSHLSASV